MEDAAGTGVGRVGRGGRLVGGAGARLVGERRVIVELRVGDRGARWLLVGRERLGRGDRRQARVDRIVASAAAARRTGRSRLGLAGARPTATARPARPPRRRGPRAPAAVRRSCPDRLRSRCRSHCPLPYRPPEPRPRERSPAATSRANASGPRATASSQSSTRSASSETSSPRWSTRPATRRIDPSRQIGPVVS